MIQPVVANPTMIRKPTAAIKGRDERRVFAGMTAKFQLLGFVETSHQISRVRISFHRQFLEPGKSGSAARMESRSILPTTIEKSSLFYFISYCCAML
jgi:hypothetical protein